MSDRVAYQDGNGSSGRRSMHSYQSVWMSHWTRMSCNAAAPQSHNHSSNPFGSKLDDNGIQQQSPYLRQKNSTLLPNIPSTSKNPSVVFGGESYPMNHSSIFFSGQSSPPEMTELEKLHHGRSTLKMPHSVHDVETMRICTSVEGLAGGPLFSQTTHSFLITKKTDVSLCKENQIFRESRASTQLTGNTLGRHHKLSPLFGHGRVGVKLQPFSSSTDSDGEEDTPDFTAFEGRKNESSTETDTMDMYSFKGKNLLSGMYLLYISVCGIFLSTFSILLIREDSFLFFPFISNCLRCFLRS